MGFKTKHLGVSVVEERFVGHIPFDQGVGADIQDPQAFLRTQVGDQRVHSVNVSRCHISAHFLIPEQGDGSGP